MKATLAILSFALVADAPGGTQLADIEKAVTSALRWQYRWLDLVPRNVAAIECSVAVFADRSLAYCEPGPLAIHIEISGKHPPRATVVLHEFRDFEKVLAGFRRNREGSIIAVPMDDPEERERVLAAARARQKPDFQQIGPVERLLIPVEFLAPCTVDWKQTERAPVMALNPRQKADIEKDGLTLRYPVVCEGDPLYLVYWMTGDEIFSISQYEIHPDRLVKNWYYDPTRKDGRAVPKLAIENLKKKELWYKPE